MPVLTTKRLSIRPFEIADLPACNTLFQSVWGKPAQPEWLEWASRNARELENLYQPPYGDHALTLRETGVLIGSAGLVPSFGPFGTLPGFGVETDSPTARRNTPEMGLFWMLSPEYRGQGYATEAARDLIAFAFAELNLGRIIATTEDDNAASIAVMRRLGMRIERNPNPEPKWFQTIGVLSND